ncbi:MAG: CotH kinase family protein [Flavobacteriales bacterium]|nr:CotH kinase family protein [Flavobacteriales bacterium]MDP4716606.1 CotH kinase family protein [Flavobacteriales bacterium]MDP4731479.1 CotH kinase family protein [Flavobacteriales bacterium]
MRTLLISLGVFFLSQISFSQQPAFNEAFLQDEVASISITIDPDSLLAMYDNLGNSHEFPASMVYTFSSGFSAYSGVGVRFRGNTSLNAQKKSFKIIVDKFVDQKFYGLEELNLIANQNDPSLLRAKLCWDFFRNAGLPACRTSYIRVYVNGTYMGVYLNAEQIDNHFADKRFDDGTGNLWKCLWGSDLTFQGTNPTLYTDDAYDLVENEFLFNYSELAQFINVLNNTPLSSLPCELEKVFNVHDYLKIMAADILLGNWDNYIFNKNNFYLYHNERTGKLEYIPYDLDNTLGIDWVNVDWAQRNLYTWTTSSNRPLFTRLLQIPVYRNEFSNYVYEFIATSFNATTFEWRAQQIQNIISSAALEDPLRPLDFGFTTDDFLNSINSAWGGQVAYGIVPFVQTRATQALQQLENLQPFTSIFNVVPKFRNDSLFVTFQSNLNANELAVVWKEIGTSTWNVETPTSEGFYGITDQLYSFAGLLPTDSINILVGAIPLIWVNDIDAHDCNFIYLYGKESSSPLVINELAPLGTDNCIDFLGSNEDWIELYNPGPAAVYLGNKFISDDASNWNKWPLPNVTLDPGEFQLLYADNDPEQGVNHLDFKLDDLSETVYISEVQNNARVLIDSITYSNIPINHSFGRATDANPNWINWIVSTPNASNLPVSVNELVSGISLYPNPVIDELHSTEKISGRIISSSGQTVLFFSNTQAIDCRNLPSGVYTLLTDKSLFRFIKSN